MPGIKSDSRCMVTKPSAKTDFDSTEMSACFSKLKELVSIPHDKKISKTQLLQHVIDYILDLELALDTHPAGLSVMCDVMGVDSASLVRQPLVERSDCNINMAEIGCSEQTSSDDFELRPPSK